MADEEIAESGESEPEGEGIATAGEVAQAAPVIEAQPPVPSAEQIDEWERTGMPPIIGDDEAVEPVTEPATPVVAAAPKPAAETPPANELTKEEIYRRAYEQQAELNQRLIAAMQQSGSAPPSGGAVQPPPTAAPWPTAPVGAPAMASLQALQPPPPAEKIAETLGVAADDPAVQAILAPWQQNYAISQMLAPIVQEHETRRQATEERAAFDYWVANKLPETERPTPAEAEQMFRSFGQIIAEEGLQYTPFNTLYKLHKARTAPAAADARQQGYQEGLKKNGKLAVASATSARPANRSVGKPEYPTLRSAFNATLAELGRR